MNPSNPTFPGSRQLFNCLVTTVIFGLVSVTGLAQTNSPGTNSMSRARRPENLPANPKLPSLFLIGDSTVRNGSGTGTGGQWGWGDQIAVFFDTGKINVVNRAVGGTTSRTFYRDLWPRVLAMIKPGDFLIMQFGTNGGAVNDASRARGEIHGIGDETQEITNQVTTKFEIVHSFGWYEKQMIADARSKGAVAMVCSLIPRNTWKGGRAARSGPDSAAGWAHGAASAVDAPFIDLNEIVARQYDALGQDKVNALFVQGQGPHTSLAGAQTNAICVIAGIKALKANPLTEFLAHTANGIVPADLSQPAPAPAVPVPDKTTPE